MSAKLPPAPPERETFVDAQARHRRAERRASASCAALVALVGLPLAVLVSPLVVAVAVLLADVANLAVPVPDLGGLAAHHVLGLTGGSPADALPPALRGLGALGGGLALLAPGVALMVATWRGVRRLLLRSGADALVLATGARPPSGDPAEQRLVHLVAEVAIAAGAAPPRVMVVDDDVANAAVVGRSPDDATILVPRGLLDDLGRDATGAVVANLLAVARGGDLRLALEVAATLQAFDLVGAVLAAPTNQRTRRALARFARLAVRRRPTGDEGAAEEARFLARELAALGRGAAAHEPARGLVAGLAQLPFLLASLAFTLMRLGPGALVVDPALAALWRRRRLRADADAVELTRDPGALARALAHLEARGSHAPAGPWAHLFLVPPTRPETNVVWNPPLQGRDSHDIGDGDGGGEGRLYEDGGHGRDWMRSPTLLGRVRLAAAAGAGRLASRRWDGAPGIGGGQARAELVTFVPTLDERLDRLHALGAHAGLAALGRRPPAPRGRTALRTTGATARTTTRAAAALTALAVACGLVYVTLVVDALVLAPPTALLHALLR